jgi:hypothetical protein
MLSILIPTYNYNVYPLVLELHKQCIACGIDFEIIVLDDAGKLIFEENKAVDKLINCHFSTSNQNIGRSKIRNLLAKQAKFGWLLFLDADTIPLHENFIINYLPYIASERQIVYGGITYSEKLIDKNCSLRWFYGKEREVIGAEKRNLYPYISFLTLNFLIPKTFFEIVSFNEEIPNLRHEDTLFSFELSKKKIPVLHIDNQIIHLGLDTNEVFLNKTRESVVALKNLVDKKLINIEYVRLSKIFLKLEQLKCTAIFAKSFLFFQSKMEKQLCSENPSMLLFDLYRLSYYCKLRLNK